MIKAIKNIATTPFYWIFVFIALAFTVVIEGLGRIYGFETKVDLLAYSNMGELSLFVFIVFWWACHLLYVVCVVRPPSPISRLREDYKNFFTWERFFQAFVLFIAYVPFIASYTYFKTMIPNIIPFQYDALFMRLDKFLHFGVHPWQVLQPVVGYALITFILSFLYKFWFAAKFFVLYWQAFSRAHLDLRAQFFLTMMLGWVINGAVFALFLSSAGPCYYDVFVTDGAANPYAGLMDYLRGVNTQYQIVHLEAQAFLMDVYRAENPRMFSGISAMPSMHMSIAMTICLVCWPHKVMRIVGLLFLLVTFLGSVHLAWHYAIDGYFAMITTFLIWRICGWAVKRYNLSEPRMKKAA